MQRFPVLALEASLPLWPQTFRTGDPVMTAGTGGIVRPMTAETPESTPRAAREGVIELDSHRIPFRLSGSNGHYDVMGTHVAFEREGDGKSKPSNN